ncbi:MAG TPA: hypothetical protein ENI23_16150, partial [bacterium]|nr:hypothetical protein [bacterium]
MISFELQEAILEKDSKGKFVFEDQIPFLLGEGEHQHFLVEQGKYYCIRKTCDGCTLQPGCEFIEEKIQISPIPHARRGIGLEEISFLILRLKEGVSIEDVPVVLWNNPFPRQALNPKNNHFLLSPLDEVFRIVKDQMRFYGSDISFNVSPYAEYFEIWDEYIPNHHLMAVDFSAIEPRISTLVSREPEWIKVFVGKPKVISKKIKFEGEVLNLPPTIIEQNASIYCYLDGEMDKESYQEQCASCPSQAQCVIIIEHYKDVSEDWHAINADGLYGPEFTDQEDKFQKKELRDVSKIVGLALTYGGSSYTVSNNMGNSEDEAQEKINAFFRKLTTLNDYMNATKRKVLETGAVWNLFGRKRDVHRWSHSKADSSKQVRRDKGYAQRTALNHPVQSTAAEFLKIAMIRVDDLILERGLNPLYGKGVPQEIDLKITSYRDLILSTLSSVHDELVFLAASSRHDEI